MSLSGGYRPPYAQGKTRPTGAKPAGRIIEDRESLREQLNAQRSSIDGPPWVSGLFAALQSIGLGLALILIPVLATSAIATTFVDQDFEFGSSFGAGLQFWALGHGGQAVLSNAAITLIPLGLTAVLILAGSFSVRRTAKPGYDAAAWYLGSYLIFALIIAMVMGARSPGAVLSVVVTTSIICGASLALGMHKRLDAARLHTDVAAFIGRLPFWLRTGIRVGATAVAAILLIAGVVLAVWFLMGMGNMANVLGQWSLDAPSGIALGIAQLALVPNLLLWAVAWASGTNFVVGTDTTIAMTQVELGPLPALPMLGAIPSEPTWPILHNLLPIILVLVCALAGLIFTRHTHWVGPWQMLATIGSAFATIFVSFMILYWLGSGSGGPNRMSEVGVHPVLGAGRLALLGAAGIILVTLLMRPEIRHWTKLGWRKVIDRITRVNDLDFVPAPPGEPAKEHVSGAPTEQVDPEVSGGQRAPNPDENQD